jgi:hypothetical protein
MKHKVTRHITRNGLEDTVKYTFNSYEDALAYAKKSDANTIKVFDATGKQLHEFDYAGREVAFTAPTANEVVIDEVKEEQTPA